MDHFTPTLDLSRERGLVTIVGRTRQHPSHFACRDEKDFITTMYHQGKARVRASHLWKIRTQAIGIERCFQRMMKRRRDRMRMDPDANYIVIE